MEGALSVVRKLEGLLKEMPPAFQEVMDLSDISVTGPNTNFFRQIKRQYGTVEADRRTVRRIVLGVEEPYIYVLR